MNVGELLDFLGNQPRENEVVLSSDSEGNSYSPLQEVNAAYFSIDENEVYDERMIKEEELDDSDESDIFYEKAPSDAKSVVVLYPV